MSKMTREDLIKWLAENRPELELVFYGGGENMKSLFRCSDKGKSRLWSVSFTSLKNGAECPWDNTENEEESESSMNENENEVVDEVYEVQEETCMGDETESVQETEVTQETEEVSEVVEEVNEVQESEVAENNEIEDVAEEVEATQETEEVAVIQESVAEEEVKVPKKRGRKPRKTADSNIAKEPKKRGRKSSITADGIRDWLKNNRPEIELVEYCGSKMNKSKFRDVESGKEFDSSVFSIMNGKGKSARVSCRALSEQTVRDWLKEHRPNIELVEYSGKSVQKSTFRCKKCGYEWSTVFSNIRNRGTGCPKCAGKVRITEEQVKAWINDNQPTVELVFYAGNVFGKSKFRCTTCGYEWETSFSHMKKSRGCPKCSGTMRVTSQQIEEWLKEHRPEIELVEYCGSKAKKSKFRDVESGKEFITSVYSIMRGKGKPMRVVNVAMSEQEVKDWLKENRPNIELVEYSGKTVQKSKFRCVTDGCVFETTVAEIKQGFVCPECRKAEKMKKVSEWLEEKYPHIELVEYSGNATAPSVFRFKNGSGHTWKKSINAIKRGEIDCYKHSCVSSEE